MEQWESYYRGGALATCPTAPDGGYDREVRQAWVEFFSLLPDGARVLDVGTGNGVVALIAAQTAAARGMRYEIHGTDLAQIDPVRDVRDGAQRFAGITFHPGVATEQLPFADEFFDAVCGHYALEYTDTAAALREMHRVLKPGGEVQFIVHHSDSLLLRSASWSLQESELVLKQTKAFRRLHRVVTMQHVANNSTERAGRELRVAIQTLKRGLDVARKAGAGRVLSVSLDAIHKLLMARQEGKPELIGLEVDRVEEDLRASLRRVNDLVAHARDEAALLRIEAQAAAAGFGLIEHALQFHAGTNLVGWQLQMRRN